MSLGHWVSCVSNVQLKQTRKINFLPSRTFCYDKWRYCGERKAGRHVTFSCHAGN